MAFFFFFLLGVVPDFVGRCLGIINPHFFFFKTLFAFASILALVDFEISPLLKACEALAFAFAARALVSTGNLRLPGSANLLAGSFFLFLVVSVAT